MLNFLARPAGSISLFIGLFNLAFWLLTCCVVNYSKKSQTFDLALTVFDSGKVKLIEHCNIFFFNKVVTFQ